MPSRRNRHRRKETAVREQESTSIASKAVLVAPSLSTQSLTPTPSANTSERVDLSQSHSLIDTNYLVINDGQFNQTRGHHTNLTINLNQTMSGSPPGSSSEFSSDSLPPNETEHNNAGPFSGQSTQVDHQNSRQAKVSSQTQEIPLQKSNDIYERHLTLKGRGFPLWIPQPNRVLHIDYRRTGVRIGDVGIITHDGGFAFLFNICLPRDDPVNPRILPEHFSPISPPIEAIDIEEFLVFQDGSDLTSASINRSQTSNTSGILFESSASEGAILTMPRGARSEDLGNYARFRQYAAANVADWYKFVNGPRGREAKNGDVRLVVGFDKSTSWGIATFANQTQQNNCRLTFGPSVGADLMTSSSSYKWECSGIAEVRAGPGSKENYELRRDSDPPDVQFENQCLFVRTLNITLGGDVWADIHSSLGSVHVDPQNNKQYPPVKDYSGLNHHHHLNNPDTSSSSNFSSSQGTRRTTGSLYRLQDFDIASDDNPTMFISGPLQSLTAHPSKVLNDFLLEEVPTAKMVITHDDDWSSVIIQYDTLPDWHKVLADILASQQVCEENGVIFLESRDISNEMLEGSASISPVQVSEIKMADLANASFNKDNMNMINKLPDARQLGMADALHLKPKPATSKLRIIPAPASTASAGVQEIQTAINQLDHKAAVKQMRKKAVIKTEKGMYNNALQIAVSEGYEKTAWEGHFGNALQAASFTGDEAIVKLLLEEADVNAQEGHFGSALQKASFQGHEAIVKLLLEKEADVNAQGGHFGNALQAASLKGHESIVKLLLEKEADVNARGRHYGSALQAASSTGHEAIVKLLLEKEADVNVQGGYYGNALQAASFQGHEAIVKLLLEKEADVNAQGGHYGNPLQAASFQGHEAIVKLLLEEADVNAQGGYYGNALQAASFQGHEAIVKLLLEKKADVNAQGGHYGNPLQAASFQGHESIVKLLLEKEADVNAQEGHYGNPLQAASFQGHESIVKLLLEKKADVNAQGGHYGNPLQAASFQGHESIVKLLLEKEADVNAQEGHYGNALQTATSRGHEAIVKLLKQKGSDVNIQKGKNDSILQAARFRGKEAFVSRQT